MVPAIQNLYKGYSSLRPDEVGPKLMKVVFAFPALLALGAQTFGSLPLKPIIATLVIAEVAFHYCAHRYPELYVKARKYEWVLDGAHLLALTWSMGCLFQNLAGRTSLFPLTAESILRTYSTHHPGRLVSYNHGPWRPDPYDTHPFDWWFLSFPVVVAGIIAIKKLVRNSYQSENSNENLKITTPYAPRWIVILQQIIYVSLAIFSKSRWTFAAFSVANLYVLYQTVFNRRVWIDFNFERYIDQKRVDFKYKELFSVKADAKKEISDELARLRKEEGEFKPFKGPQAILGEKGPYRICAMKEPFSGNNQVFHRELSIHSASIKKQVELSYFDYKAEQEVQLQIQGFDKTARTLSVSLDNGVVADFPNALTKKVLEKGLEGKIMKVQMGTFSVIDAVLHISCFSKDLPKSEDLSIKSTVQLRGKSFVLTSRVAICETGLEKACLQCSKVSQVFYYESSSCESATLCRACIQADFEEKVKNFRIVNTATEGGYTLFPIYTVYAEKDQLPEGAELKLSSTVITWLDYQVGQKLQVQVKKIDEQDRAVIGYLQCGTVVVFQNVSLSSLISAKKMVAEQKTVDAQVIYKNVRGEDLHLDCLSDRLPQSAVFKGSIAMDDVLNAVQYEVFYKPKILKKGEVSEPCSICYEPSAKLFSPCSNSLEHTTCSSCLSTYITKYVNSKLKVDEIFQSSEGYIVSIDKSCLPNCPLCRSQFFKENKLSMWINNVPAAVNLTDRLAKN